MDFKKLKTILSPSWTTSQKKSCPPQYPVTTVFPSGKKQEQSGVVLPRLSGNAIYAHSIIDFTSNWVSSTHALAKRQLEVTIKLVLFGCHRISLTANFGRHEENDR